MEMAMAMGAGRFVTPGSLPMAMPDDEASRNQRLSEIDGRKLASQLTNFA
jgi:hypothetical protein